MNDQKGPSIAIAAYRPRRGKEAELLDTVKDHLPVLRRQGLVTDRAAIVMRANDGTIIEVFEWKSEKAIEEAHSDPEVQKLWKRFGEVSDYVAPADIEECKRPFSGFEPINV